MAVGIFDTLSRAWYPPRCRALSSVSFGERTNICLNATYPKSHVFHSSHWRRQNDSAQQAARHWKTRGTHFRLVEGNWRPKTHTFCKEKRAAATAVTLKRGVAFHFRLPLVNNQRQRLVEDVLVRDHINDRGSQRVYDPGIVAPGKRIRFRNHLATMPTPAKI